jgi:uncharacterized OB-fold protein
MSGEMPRHWRLFKQRYGLVGEVCPDCEAKIFPPRDVCPECAGAGIELINVAANLAAEMPRKSESALV